MTRIVIVTNGNYFARVILDRLLSEHNEDIAAIVLVDGDYKGRTGLNAVWSIGKDTSTQYMVYKIAQYGLFKLAHLIFRKALFTVSDLAHKFNIYTFSTVKINIDEAIEFISAMNP